MNFKLFEKIGGVVDMQVAKDITNLSTPRYVVCPKTNRNDWDFNDAWCLDYE